MYTHGCITKPMVQPMCLAQGELQDLQGHDSSHGRQAERPPSVTLCVRGWVGVGGWVGGWVCVSMCVRGCGFLPALSRESAEVFGMNLGIPSKQTANVNTTKNYPWLINAYSLIPH